MKALDDIPLAVRERAAIRAAARALASRFPVESVILFGSKARGDSGPESDMDLLVLTSRDLGWQERGRIVDVLFDIGMDHDVIFSPLIVECRKWTEGIYSVLPIHAEVARDGVAV